MNIAISIVYDELLYKSDEKSKFILALYCESDGARIIELPYRSITEKISENGDFLGVKRYDELDISMYAILSDNEVNPQSLITAAKSSDRFKRTYVKLSIPKFEFVIYDNSDNTVLFAERFAKVKFEKTRGFQYNRAFLFI